MRDFADLVIDLPFEDIDSQTAGDNWVARVVLAARRRRNVVPARQSDMDIVDPYGGSASDFARMASQIDAALTPIVRALKG